MSELSYNGSFGDGLIAVHLIKLICKQNCCILET